MLTYQPECDDRTRIVWYGGESTQLHFQHRGITDRWIDIETQTLGQGIPSGVKELLADMQEFYNYCYANNTLENI
jgi:hypothetical protein